MNAPDLAYVGLAVRDVEAVSRVFGEHLGLARRNATLADGTRVPLFGVGETALAVFEAGHAFLGADAQPGVHHVAFASDSPEAFTETAGFDLARHTLTEGIDGAPQVEIDTQWTCGIRTRICAPVAIERGDSEDVERIDHIGVASADNEKATGVFTGKLGCPVESTQTDMEVRMAIETFSSDRYGVVYHNRPPQPVGGLRVAFLGIGDCDLELLEPFDPEPEYADASGPAPDRPGNTRGDRGAIGRYIERRGPGLHHLALKTPHINALLPRLAGRGLRMIDTLGRPGSRRALIGFIHPAALGGVLLHFVQRDER
jgi:methylmalonyl-CoA/ethylmalonyl-CoA epimerase